MPIVVAHEPDARVIGPFSLAAGQGAYRQRQQQQANEMAIAQQRMAQDQYQQNQQLAFRRDAMIWENQQREADREAQRAHQLELNQQNFGQQKELVGLHGDQRAGLMKEEFRMRGELEQQAQEANFRRMEAMKKADEERQYQKELMKPIDGSKYQLTPQESMELSGLNHDLAQLRRNRDQFNPLDFRAGLLEIEQRRQEFLDTIREKPAPTFDDKIAQRTRPAKNDKGEQIGFWVEDADGNPKLSPLRTGNAGKDKEAEGSSQGPITRQEVEAARKLFPTHDSKQNELPPPTADELIEKAEEQRRLLDQANYRRAHPKKPGTQGPVKDPNESVDQFVERVIGNSPRAMPADIAALRNEAMRQDAARGGATQQPVPPQAAQQQVGPPPDQFAAQEAAKQAALEQANAEAQAAVVADQAVQAAQMQPPAHLPPDPKEQERIAVNALVRAAERPDAPLTSTEQAAIDAVRARSDDLDYVVGRMIEGRAKMAAAGNAQSQITPYGEYVPQQQPVPEKRNGLKNDADAPSGLMRDVQNPVPPSVPFTWTDPKTGRPNRDLTKREADVLNNIKIAPGTTDVLIVTSPLEKSLLPPGTKYIAPNGKTYVIR